MSRAITVEHGASLNQNETWDWGHVRMAPSSQTQLTVEKPRTLGDAVFRGQSPASQKSGEKNGKWIWDGKWGETRTLQYELLLIIIIISYSSIYLFYSIQFPPMIFCCSNLSYLTQLSISFDVFIKEKGKRYISESTE